VTISNPILPGFHPDPSILRVGSDYYLATSTFEWLPAVQVHHSTDLDSWRLVGHVLSGEQSPELRGIPSSAGVWAPSLTYDPQARLFYLVYSIMKNQSGEMFDVDNFVVSAPDILGPWSAPVYLTSVGFDASLFHDDDGRKWVVTLEWDPREGYEHPGAIVIQEFFVDSGLVGPPRRIHRGSSDRGALEGPNLYKRDGVYYLMTAEGGTGFGHGVSLARSTSIEGPYEADPQSPFITSWPEPYFARNNRDYLRPEFDNPAAALQKAGHGSLVDTPDGEWFVAHLSARPLAGSRRSTLGRETSIQAVEWNEAGWLRLVSGGTLAQPETRSPAQGGTVSAPRPDLSVRAEFDTTTLPLELNAPRRRPDGDWADLEAQAGYLTMRGGDSLFSTFDVSLIAARQRTFVSRASTVVDFEPTHFSQSAGLVVYYNALNWIQLRVYLSETLGGRAIAIMEARDGVKTERMLDRQHVTAGAVRLDALLDHDVVQFSWGQDGEALNDIGPRLDISYLSDEVTRGFTGTFVGITVQDSVHRDASARFGHFHLLALGD
jgi:xylan 1,4-beta-xylosidase